MLLLPIPDLQLCTPNQRLRKGLALQRLPHFRMKKVIGDFGVQGEKHVFQR